MKQYKTLLKIILITTLFLFIKIGFTQLWKAHDIENNIWSSIIKTGDIDNDMDDDILLLYEDHLIWKNNPGWSSHVIGDIFPMSTNAWLDLFDLDNDGDLDAILSSYYNPGRLSWFENQNNGYTWTEHIICESLNFPSCMPYSYGDLDQDGDIDLVVPNYGNGEILWFENYNKESLWIQHDIGNLEFVLWSTVTDLDGDNDLDIVAGNQVPGIIIWYENTLSGSSWTEHDVSTLLGNSMAYCVDLDGDNDQDIVTSSFVTNELVYYSNPEWEKVILSNELSNPIIGIIGDIDDDNDLDVTFGNSGSSPGEIGWLENTENASNWTKYIIGGLSIYSRQVTDIADMDEDGDKDFIVSSINNNNLIGKAEWYSNPNITVSAKNIIGESQNEKSLIQVYPNPFKTSTNIDLDLPQNSFVSLKIFDSTGKEIQMLVSEKLTSGHHKYNWRPGKLSDGQYIIHLTTDKYSSVHKIHKLK